MQYKTGYKNRAMNNAKSLKLEAYSLTERNINFKRNYCISEQGYIPSRVHVCTFVHKISEVIHVVGKACYRLRRLISSLK